MNSSAHKHLKENIMLNAKGLYNEAYAQELGGKIFEVWSMADVNTGDTLGPRIFANECEWFEFWVRDVESILCDNTDEEIYQWFAARGVKG